MGASLEEPRKGSHWIARFGSESYPIPLHNGLKTEVSDKYIKGLCRAFGLAFEDLRTKL